MRGLVQRVAEASVSVNGAVVGKISRGVLVLVGVTHTDTEVEAEQLAKKVVHLRIFPDSEGKMNLNVLDIGGELLAVSQFTLYGNTQKGNRPSYAEAAAPGKAEIFYKCFIESSKGYGIRVETGQFQAHMLVQLINDGPVTILCDTNSK